MKNGKTKRIILLAAAITVTVLALLFSLLAAFSAKKLSYVAAWVFVSLAVLSFWGAPILYYYAAKVRFALRSLSDTENVDGGTAEASLKSVEGEENVEA